MLGRLFRPARLELVNAVGGIDWAPAKGVTRLMDLEAKLLDHGFVRGGKGREYGREDMGVAGEVLKEDEPVSDGARLAVDDRETGFGRLGGLDAISAWKAGD
jgi:hypothetical protein